MPYSRMGIIKYDVNGYLQMIGALRVLGSFS